MENYRLRDLSPLVWKWRHTPEKAAGVWQYNIYKDVLVVIILNNPPKMMAQALQGTDFCESFLYLSVFRHQKWSS